jgi:hypothetical protein
MITAECFQNLLFLFIEDYSYNTFELLQFRMMKKDGTF